MVQHEAPDNNHHDLEAELAAALERISDALDDDIDDQVNKEILRYWHERVRQAGNDADRVRRIRAEIAQLILSMR